MYWQEAGSWRAGLAPPARSRRMVKFRGHEADDKLVFWEMEGRGKVKMVKRKKRK